MTSNDRTAAPAPPERQSLAPSRRAVFRTPLPHMTLRSERAAVRLVVALALRRIHVENAAPVLAHEGPLILAPNHVNYLEALWTPSMLIWLRSGRKTAFLSDWMFRHIPVVGWLIDVSGALPVWHKPAKVPGLNRFRKSRVRNPLADAERHLGAGGWIALYPEGKRNPDPRRLLPGRRGVARLALSTGVPVLPIGIDWPGRERGRRAPALPRLIYRFGSPLAVDDLCPVGYGSESRGGRCRREAELRITRKVMQAIGDLSGKAPAEQS